jgi:hypothetical protein
VISFPSMKRRRFMQALVAAPAAPVLLGQQTAGPLSTEAPTVPALRYEVPDVAADPVLKFFEARQFATLRRLSQLLAPPMDGAPGAIDARAPEFLDFLLSESMAERQKLYLNGLDTLERESQTRFRKPFAEIDETQAGQILAPLRQAWTYRAPNAFAEFLRAAREDVRTATRNSPEWSAAGHPPGAGLYWKPVA